jgi:hypothetical protein
MATTEASSRGGKLARAWDYLLAGRPAIAWATALFTTTGHTMNLREMSFAQGWVAAEFYSLQSAYLVSLALMMLACPTLGQRWSCRGLAQTGLAMMAAGSFLNGLEIWAPLPIFVAGRVVAGAGAGMVIYFAPRLLDQRWDFPAIWAAIVLPVAGPGVVSAATTLIGEVSDWQSGFLFEAGAAVVSLVALLSMERTHESPPSAPHGSLAYLPPLVVAFAALLYDLHWGQLHGWLESTDIVISSAVAIAAFAVALWLLWPQLDWPAFEENWTRLLLFFFGGMNLFFHGYTMNTYGGSLVNFSSWQRAWLIWPVPIGVAAGIALGELVLRRVHRMRGFSGAVLGLLLLAGGLFLQLRLTLEWPYWQPLDALDLNWFPAPQHWELAPGRYLMGLGIGLFMISMNFLVSADPMREEKIVPLLPVMQFLGGGVAAALLINFLLIGHAVHYSYSADRDYIQAEEMDQHRSDLRQSLAKEGAAAPDRAAEALLYRGVNYEADNLVFASIYAAFLVAALFLAGICVVLPVLRRLRVLS